MKEIKSVSILIKGKVQGVWYRVSAQEQANKLGLVGLVKNLPNGSVCAEVEGVEETIKVFVDWCKQGPANAQVEEVIISEQFIKGYESFKIER